MYQWSSSWLHTVSDMFVSNLLFSYIVQFFYQEHWLNRSTEPFSEVFLLYGWIILESITEFSE